MLQALIRCKPGIFPCKQVYSQKSLPHILVSDGDLTYWHGQKHQLLSKLEKQVLDLHLTGMNYIEIAHILNRDEKSTDNALQRIRAKVRSWKQ